ncbi:MAG TPA: phosphopantetheine-binding protein [Actinomycetota bacterium]|jgi:acyl carrier protein|nr:phosphopantetheine-binding protein [Actinomycetota bacterium]
MIQPQREDAAVDAAVAAETAIADRVAMIFEERGIDVPDPGTDLITGGLLDSLALVELLVQLEEEFDIRIAFDRLDLEDFRTIKRIVAFITRLRCSIPEP